MSFDSEPKDNSELFLKLLLRKSLISLSGISFKGTALDLFSGRGEISSRLYRSFSELYCVEKDIAKFKWLEEKFKESQNVHLFQMDNIKFLKKHLHGINSIELLDFDAYGTPNKTIKTFFEIYPVREKIVIFATDGGKLARLRCSGFSPSLYSVLNRDELGTENKGYGYNSILIREYERLIRQFWFELSNAYGFKIELFKLLWKKGKGVAYYGALILPK